MKFNQNIGENHEFSTNNDDGITPPANDPHYFPPVTVCIGHRVTTAEGKPVPQPTHSQAEHRILHNLDELAAALTDHPIALPEDATAADRKQAKITVPYFVLGGLKNGGSPEPISAKNSKDKANDIYRRLTGNIAPCPMIALDVDESSREVFEKLTGGELAEFNEVPATLDAFAAVAYTTPSHTAEAPRFRVLVMCNAAVQPEDKGTVSRQIERQLMAMIDAEPLPPVQDESGKLVQRPGQYQTATGGAIKFDSSVYTDNQVIYLPANNGQVWIFDGAAVVPDELPALPPEVLATSRSSGKAVNATTAEGHSDAAAWLLENGIAEENNDRTLNILCAWHEDHGDGGGEINNGTVFIMDADPRAERFKCSHNSCNHRLAGESGVQLEYARALGMPEDIAQKAWGSVAHVDEFDVIEVAGGELVAQGSVTINPNLFKLADSELATLCLRNLPGAAYDTETGQFYRYEARSSRATFGTWQELNEASLSRYAASVMALYGSTYQSAKLVSVVKAMRWQAQPMQQPRAGVIGFANGIYDLANETFTPHAPEHWLTVTNGITWSDAAEGESLDASAPNFAGWLGWTSEDDEQKALAIKALFYAILTNRYEWQKFYELTGAGGTGKGTAMAVCELLAGKQNATSIETDLLDTARGRAPLLGKSLITLPDQKQYTGNGSGLRAITGGDSVMLDPKNKHPFSVVLRANIVAANNNPMIFTERAGGIERRRVIFRFDRVVPEGKRDRQLMDKIGNELPVIVRDLLATFPNGKGAEAALIEQMHGADARAIKTDSDPLTHFASLLEFGPHSGTGLALSAAVDKKGNELAHPEEFAVYPAYLKYCEQVGGKPLGLVAFRNGMEQAAAVHGATFKRSGRKWCKQLGQPVTPTNITYRPELAEFVPRAFPEDMANHD